MVVILAERAADERRADAGQRLDLIVAGVHVCDDLVGGEGIIMIMRVGVVHELIAAVHDGLGLFGILIRPVAHDKKVQVTPYSLSTSRIFCVLSAPHAASNEMEHTFWSRWTQ